MKGYIDMHCDTLMHAFIEQKRNVYQIPECMFDFLRFHEHNGRIQFLAVFFPPMDVKMLRGKLLPDDMIYFQELHKIYEETVALYPDHVQKVRNWTEYQNNVKSGRCSALLTMEDGRAINGNLEILKYFYDQDVRLISLTWNHENCFGYPNSRDENMMKKGLKLFGKDAIEFMNKKGMIIDVSHLSDGGFFDVADISKKPFVASHSNCRAITSHPRNMTDHMIRILADKGGVMGINFCPEFLDIEEESAKSTVDLILNHMRHAVNIGGIECVGIGTDFDGIHGDIEVKSPNHMEMIWDAMKVTGFSEDDIDKISFQNVERIIKDVL